MKRWIILLIAVVCVGAVIVSDHCARIAHGRTMLLIDVKNTVCPVTGEKITAHRYNTSYNGKRYWFSSYTALREFKTDPAKYVQRLQHLTR